MPAKKYRPEQIVSLPRHIEAVANDKSKRQGYREAGISEQSYYRWSLSIVIFESGERDAAQLRAPDCPRKTPKKKASGTKAARKNACPLRCSNWTEQLRRLCGRKLSIFSITWKILRKDASLAIVAQHLAIRLFGQTQRCSLKKASGLSCPASKISNGLGITVSANT